MNTKGIITGIGYLVVVLLLIGLIGAIGVPTASATDGADNTTITVKVWVGQPDICDGHNIKTTVEYDVTNNSTYYDASGIITDNHGFSGSFGPLGPGATQKYTVPISVSGTATFTATATATFDDPAGTTYTDSASRTVHGHNCTITLEKTADPAEVCKETGGDVTYTYTLTNNSDYYTWEKECPSCADSLWDDQLGTIANSITLLPGETKAYTKTATVSDTLTNTAIAKGVFFMAPMEPTTEDKSTVTVTGIVCSPTATAGGPYTVDEGSCVTLNGSGTDPQVLPLTYAWDLNGDGVYETPGQSPPFCAVDGPMTVPVALQVCDPAGLCATASSTVTINNVAPTVGPITAPIDPVQVKTAITASSPFTDPGILDAPDNAVWDWGDGSTSAGTISDPNGSGSVSGSHTYGFPGVYTITLFVIDKDGGIGSAVYEYVVVYDPNGGFVTGGGWINSPPGAYPANPKLTGKANFGFVSQYQKGATVPTGNTEFQFHAADLNFHSTSYQWLVVAGTKAMYKGYGTINGTGKYGFMLTAIDGNAKNAGAKDKFRIKIWDVASGRIIYDNQKGAPDNALPTTVIAGGSIVIHAP